MRFLYRRRPVHLENLCRQWHLIAVRCGAPLWRREHRAPTQERHMLDLIMLAIGLGFFALSVGYAYACERL